MATLYYIEVNLICVIILFLIATQFNYRSTIATAAGIILNRMLWATVFMCASDAIAGVFAGRVFAGSLVLTQIGNIGLYITITFVTYQWMMYVLLRLKKAQWLSPKLRIVCALPLLVTIVAAITNPLTGFFFSINEQNVYSRGGGIVLHWAMTWVYFAIATIISIREYHRVKNKLRRSEIRPLLFFSVAPAVAAVTQMLLYGVITVQVGVTISILMLFFEAQKSQVITDALTGLNNRHGLNLYADNLISHGNELWLTVMMVDVCNFKQINDKFGHMAGDRALINVAEVLKEVCSKSNGRLFLCRYGGDEFVIIAVECSKREAARLEAMVHESMNAKRRQLKLAYDLRVTVGAFSGHCVDENDVEQLIKAADAEMYKNK